MVLVSLASEEAVAKVNVQGKRIREGSKGKIVRIIAEPKQRKENSSYGFIECDETGETFYFSLVSKAIGLLVKDDS